ncbi:MAG: hypothetical protein US53_C0007G0020 [Candidatus Woesebacteria bacterium GW2011_GWA1_37_7]|uniref:Uncharacterized protein n=1 Tax=Candidatus Woesebacteria bacterium GW2011_GWA1_37_7 TaxID=1618545 RepID=A0A0G0KBB1_9BACT|nr:MAG: hypothetical protein US53_C0007G0020 [Candidatus Woesebacteria bacterium GW2011_GWA1_37_7]
MGEKITGILLLVLGLLVIAMASLNIYFLFSGKVAPFSLIRTKGISLDIKGPTLPDSTEIPFKTEILEADVLDRLVNISFHFIFMGFLVNVGYKVASLGVQFLRPVKVNLRGPEAASKDKSILSP